MDLLTEVKKAKRVYICGNGGSAANAIHIANDLVSVGIRACALTADIATLTAIANDFGYEYVFARQLEVFGDSQDLLIVLSGSGESPNIINAIITANSIGMHTWALVGNFNPRLPKAAGLAINFSGEGDNMQAAEEIQLLRGHELMLALKREKT